MKEFLNFIFQDYENFGLPPSFLSLIKSVCVQKSYKLILLFRFLQYKNFIDRKRVKRGLFYPIMVIAHYFFKKRFYSLCDILNVTLSEKTMIGKGISFPHAFPVVINPASIIGEYCIINPCVLIGRDRGKNGAPIIGSYCFIGHGVKIIGNPKIGDWSFLCPGAIITKDIPSCSLVGGINNIINSEGRKHVLQYLSPIIREKLKNENINNNNILQ